MRTDVKFVHKQIFLPVIRVAKSLMLHDFLLVDDILCYLFLREEKENGRNDEKIEICSPTRQSMHVHPLYSQ